MGNSSSSSERDELGDRLFLFAKEFLQGKTVVDDAKLEGITGIILDSCSSLDEINYLLANDTKELERRISKSSLLLEVESEKASCSKTVLQIISNDSPGKKSCLYTASRRQELINHFEKLNPDLDSVKIADELLRLPEHELNYVMSNEGRFNDFVMQSSKKSSELLDTSNTQSAIGSKVALVNSSKSDKIELKPELSKEDVDALIGNQLFQKVNELHPSKAEVITGVLMGLDKDILLHLIASSCLLHKNIALVTNELRKIGKLSQRDIVTMQEELGDVIYAVLEKEMDVDKASHVTGMFLELSIAEIHEVLSDEKIFRNRIKTALLTLNNK
eukprot:gene9031-9998_t